MADVNLDVSAGCWTAVLGPSGSGKTTLLRAIAGFERIDRGEITAGNRTLAAPGVHVAPERRGIGMLAQQGALFPHMNVDENVRFGLGSGWVSRRRRSRRARRARVEELLEMVGLPGYGQRRVYELSGGQQQRVALARALAPSPGIILLDEPFTGLDASLREELGQEMRSLLREIGTTVVLVTHDRQEALSLTDHVAVMRDGRVIQAGAPEVLYEAPGDPGTARFLGDAVMLPARLPEPGESHAARLEAYCALGRVGVRDLSPAVEHRCRECVLMLRPEQLEFSADGVTGRVVGGSFFGHDAIVHVRLGDNADGPVVQVRTMDEHLPVAGTRVGVRVRGCGTAFPVPGSGSGALAAASGADPTPVPALH